MRRTAALLVLLSPALLGCGEDEPVEPVEPAPPPAVQQRTKPVWCPGGSYEQVRRPDGRFDVERVPHGTLDARDLLGKTLRDAERIAERGKCEVRVVKRDGEDLGRTDDLRNNRINVAVERGYVIALQGID